MSEKLCMFCEHYVWNEPYEYSEMTAGGGDFTCWKGHYESNWNGNYGTLNEFRIAILRAKECPDYSRVTKESPNVD